MAFRRGLSLIGVTASALMIGGAALAAGQSEWLSLCGQCLNPTITSKSGVGTASARAEGRITREDAAGWCQNWEPPGSDMKKCVREQMSGDDAKKTYVATADCPGGRLTAIDGVTYMLAGKWTNDIGRGRSKWRDASGKIVGQDNASNGLAISQQWEVLCPGATGAGRTTAAATARSVGAYPGPNTASPPIASAGGFAAGQIVEAKYGSDWVRGRLNRIRSMPGPAGPVIAYDVTLDNGKRGVLPARMVRAVER